MASVFIVRATGLDKGLIDELMQGVVEAVSPAPEVEQQEEAQE